MHESLYRRALFNKQLFHIYRVLALSKTNSKPSHAETLAIVGMAFRLPGDLSTRASLWQALKEGRDLVTEVPGDRWAIDTYQHPRRSEPGKSVTFSAGVLSDAGEFDPSFFGISPREANKLDPQQRLLLELTWRTFEDAGIPASQLAGSDCAVYVGISGLDYGMRVLDDLPGMDAYSMTGSTLSIAANRISYTFDLHGPSMAVDTACSSSLVALHMACETVRRGEASTALIGGVNMLLHPYPFVCFSKASMLSAQGRCRTFAAGGDGYVRSEGGGMFLIKTLEQAQRDGDHIHAVIRATGTNADGARKTGLTIPSPEGQRSLIQTVLGRSGLRADEIDYIEAHGTGTSVGDPIETHALGQALGQYRAANQPLPIGSIKSNLGHMEPASGMAGMVKAILTLQNREIPPSIHAQTLNPDIDFTALNLKVATESVSLAGRDHPLRVGINSFGFGGANAHAILEEAPAQPSVASGTTDRLPPLVFSARADEALTEYARQYRTALADDPVDLPGIAYNAALRRDWLDQRCAVFGDNLDEIRNRLSALADGESPRGVVQETALENTPETGNKVAFIYSGNGAQWVGMALSLRQQSPRFAQQLDRLDRLIQPHTGFSIIAELEASAENSRITDTAVAQPLLFAIQVGITELLREDGIEADATMGHSVGEVAAAWAAGCYTLEQAIDVVCKRSAAQGKTHGTGKMMAIGLAADAIPALIEEAGLQDHWIELAALNDPASVTLAGDPATLAQFSEWLNARGVFNRVLDLDYAFHSQAMDPIHAEIMSTLADLRPSAGHGGFVSTVTGGVLSGTQLDADYWWRNVRLPVHFSEATEALITIGCRIFVEIGPNAILQRYLTQCASKADVAVRILPTQRKDADQWIDLNETIHRIHLLRGPESLRSRLPAQAPLIALPGYPWQRQRYWADETEEGYDLISRHQVHPLLGYPLKEMEAGWENTLDPETLGYLADHAVGGAVVLPGAAYAEMALMAGRLHFDIEHIDLEELEILQPLVFETGQSRLIRLELTPRDGSFQIRSRTRLSSDDWSLHAAGRLLGAPLTDMTSALPPLPDHPDTLRVSGTEHYRVANLIGLNYGPTFQGLSQVRVDGDMFEGTIDLPDTLSHAPDHLLHPTVLDLCFQALISHQRQEILAGHGVTLLPVKMGRLQWRDTGRPITGLRGALRRRSPHSALADFELYNDLGELAAQISDCRFRASVIQQADVAAPPLWHITTQPKPHQADARSTLALAAPAVWGAHVTAAIQPSAAAPGRQVYHQEISPLLDALVSAYVYQTYAQLLNSGWMAEQAGSTAVTAESQAILDWMQAVMTRQGWLAPNDQGAHSLVEADAPPAPDIIWTTLMGEYPICAPEITLIGRVGLALNDLVRGTLDPTIWAQSVATSAQLAQMQETGVSQQGKHLLLDQALRTVLTHSTPAQPLRILLIGATHTAVIAYLGTLAAERPLELVITHPDAEALDDLRSHYEREPWLIVANLDAQTGQLTAPHALPAHYDLLLFPDGMDQIPQYPNLLRQLRRQLAAGGQLLSAEQAPALFQEFIHLTDADWWPQQAYERTSPLIPSENWSASLPNWGFTAPEIIHEPSDDLKLGNYLVAAQNIASITADADTAEEAPAGWLLLAGNSTASAALGRALSERLEAAGQHVILASDETADTADMSALLEHAAQRLGTLNHIVNLAAVAPTAALTPDDAGQALCLRALNLLHALEQRRDTPPRLWWIAPGGALISQPDATHTASPASAALWGMGRVVMNEYPALDLTLIDTADSEPGAPLVTALLREFLVSDPEREILLTPQHRCVPRMQRLSAAPHSTANPDAVIGTGTGTDTGTETATRYQLQFDVPGQLKNLKWRPQIERALAADEIEVRVKSVGLNFRDVMYAMGLLSDEAVENGFSGPSLGLEFSGIVSRVGAEVSHLKPGDDVLGFGPQCFASHVITHAGAVARKPAHWSFAEAATVPTVFFTVYYALVYLARLDAGERVLIHGAAGGVGIAAIELARHLKAEIHATAGSDEKRDFVTLLGVDHRYSSRDLAFADQILAATGGVGVDVVLNSLAGEAINRNLHVLKPFGRFLELGKRDFYENTQIGLRPFKDNLSYFGIDADQLMAARPELAAKLFAEVMALFHDGVLHPLPHRTFPATQVVDAFRYMQQAKQIGKVVVNLDEAPPIEPARHAAAPSHIACRADGAYLVSGGLTGFGFETARWLLSRGAGRVILLGRRGLQTPGISERLAQLGTAAERVQVMACDVTDTQSLANVVQLIEQNGHHLRGVIHAAMVLDDALMHNLDASRFRTTFAAKAAGGWNLHTATQNSPLEFFVVYSSATTFIGNPGQANYVAANGFLEGLTHLRRAQGKPATALCWGPLGDVGYLVDNQSVQEGLEVRLGGKAITAAEALDALESALVHDQNHVAVMRMDWHAVERSLPNAGAKTFEQLRRTAGRASQNQDGDIRALLLACTPEEAHQKIAEMLADEVAQVLGLSVERIDRKKSLFDMGLDSLMGVELALGIEKRFGVHMPAMVLNEGPTIERLAERVFHHLFEHQAPATESQQMETLVRHMAEIHSAQADDTDIAQMADLAQSMKNTAKAPSKDSVKTS